MTAIDDIIGKLEEIAPPELADEGDPIGLQVGSASGEVRRICVAVDTSPPVIDAAIEHKADLLVAHHPLVYRPLKALVDSDPVANSVAKLIRAGTSLYVVHTNFDAAPGGMSDVLARVMGVVDCSVLKSTRQDTFHKIVVFVPEESIDDVMSAMAGAGAGRIGQYTHCSFRAPGVGTFVPLPAAQPYIGTTGKLEAVDELRLEMLCVESWLENVIESMIEAHPYDEVAYDVYKLANEPVVYGHGRIGTLRQPTALGTFAEHVKSVLGLPYVKTAGDEAKSVSKIAFCAGGASSLFREAARSNADVFLTGDTKHHDVLDANALGLAVIDVGHFESERPGMQYLADRLASLCAEDNVEVAFIQ